MIKFGLVAVFLFTTFAASFSQSLDDCKRLSQRKGFVHLGSYKSSNFRAFDENDYYVGINPATWNNAETDCRNTFGSNAGLLAIESEEERDQLNIMLESYGSGYTYWTSGIYDMNGRWRWAIENTPAFAPWAPWDANQPTPNPTALHRVLLAHSSRFSARWRSVVNTQLHRYICELPKTTVAVPCYETNDLVIVLDSSGSIGSANYEKAKCFVEKLAAAFTVHSPSKLGFIIYSSTVSHVFYLTSPLSPSSISDAILAAPYMAQSTATDLGIYQAVNQFAGLPNTTPRNIVVLTDGVSDFPADTITASKFAVNSGIRTFSVGITPSVNLNELLAIAGGNPQHVFTTDNFDELIKLLTPLSLQVCPV